MAAAAATEAAGGTERRCIVTRRPAPRGGLVRFVISPAGEVVPDVAERLPGRGLWVTACSAIMARACAENAFARAARRSAAVPADLAERVPALVDRQCMALIALARRSGAAVAGFEKVRAAVRNGRAALVLEATDGAAAGHGRIRREAGGLRAVALWTAGELGVPFARERVVHAAIGPGGLCDRLVREVERLEGLRGHCRKADGT